MGKSSMNIGNVAVAVRATSDKLTSFARREPALCIGAAFALGLLGGRFLRSSAHRSRSADLAGGTAGGPSAGSETADYRDYGDYDRFELSYVASFDDDQYDYLSGADLEHDVDSQRFGTSR